MAKQNPDAAFKVGEIVRVPYSHLLDKYGDTELSMFLPDSPLLVAKIVGKDWGPNSRHRGITFPGWFYHLEWKASLPRIIVSEEILNKWQR